jgi:hypothetical protein
MISITMVRHLEIPTEYFENKYGVVPRFKSGLHSGFIIAGEMGLLKEILYTPEMY